MELAFGTTSETAIGELGPEAIRDGRRAVVKEAEARGLVHIIQLDGKPIIRLGAAPEGQATLMPEPTNADEPFPSDRINYPKDDGADLLKEPVGSGTARAAKGAKKVTKQ